MSFAGTCELGSDCSCGLLSRGSCPNRQEELHTVRCPAGESPVWQVVYWKGNTAASASDATRANVEIFVPGLGYCQAMSFILPLEKSQLEHFERTLMRIYSAGKRARSREIQRILDDSK
jgi:hypothetical protein